MSRPPADHAGGAWRTHARTLRAHRRRRPAWSLVETHASRGGRRARRACEGSLPGSRNDFLRDRNIEQRAKALRFGARDGTAEWGAPVVASLRSAALVVVGRLVSLDQSVVHHL